jgi:hypothetical protein
MDASDLLIEALGGSWPDQFDARRYAISNRRVSRSCGSLSGTWTTPAGDISTHCAETAKQVALSQSPGIGGSLARIGAMTGAFDAEH